GAGASRSTAGGAWWQVIHTGFAEQPSVPQGRFRNGRSSDIMRAVSPLTVDWHEDARMTWVFDLPLIVSGPALLLLLLAFSLGGLAFFRRRVLPALRFKQDESTFGAGMVSSIMVFYGLSMALVSVNVWESYQKVQDVTSGEATALNLIYRD